MLEFENQAYVHKLNSQELGYRNNIPGKAGRYFYISKACAGFFPPLSDTVKNDHIFINIIPPHSNEVVLTTYMYHNSKVLEDGQPNGRDEYRLYLNSKNDPGREFYKEDDIVVLVKLFDHDTDLYKVLYVKKGTEEYEKINILLRAVDSRRGSHGLVALKELTFLKALEKIDIGTKIIPPEVLEESLKEPHQPTNVIEENDTTRIMRSRSFRDLVLFFYNYKCAVTNNDMFINYKDFNNLEAAHIRAIAAGGGNHPSNGFALERNLHWAFDKGFFTISEDYKIKVHPEAMKIPYLSQKDGQELFFPEDSRARPELSSIRWHNQKVFGLFLKTEF